MQPKAISHHLTRVPYRGRRRSDARSPADRPILRLGEVRHLGRAACLRREPAVDRGRVQGTAAAGTAAADTAAAGTAGTGRRVGSFERRRREPAGIGPAVLARAPWRSVADWTSAILRNHNIKFAIVRL
jgi:hypothetical protein